VSAAPKSEPDTVGTRVAPAGNPVSAGSAAAASRAYPAVQGGASRADASPTPPVSAVLKAGRADAAARRKAQRRGRERGCWVYITAEQLARSEVGAGGSVPWYRIWGGQRGRYVVTLYAEA